MIDQKLEHLYPAFRDKISNILTDWTAWCETHYPGHHAVVAEGFRTQARQQELYAQGRTKPGEIVTEKNGTSNPSNHQSCLAVDIVLAKGTALSWDLPAEAWAYLGHLARAQGLTSGSDWKTFKDQPHVEWPSTDRATYRAAAMWKSAQKLV